MFDPVISGCLEAVTACPLCGGTGRADGIDAVEDFFFRQVSGTFDFARCGDCDSLYLTQRLTPDCIGEAYKSYYTHRASPLNLFSGFRGFLRYGYVANEYGSKPKIRDKIASLIFRRLGGDIEQLEAHLRFIPPAPGAILDYGCGSGDFLDLVRPFGYDVTGVDLDPEVIFSMRERGIDCFTPAQADQLGWSEVFDAIALSHVIEHVFDPDQLIAKLSGWLKPGGVLFLEAPNAEAEGVEIYGRYWRGLEAPRHISVPTFDTIKQLLEMNKLSISKRLIRDGIRRQVWEASLQAAPTRERENLRKLSISAPPEKLQNCEFITVLAVKPEQNT